jgi:hypothetical protein
MIESEWLACTDPEPMLKFLRSKADERKLRLFAVACCRRIWHLLTDELSRKTIESAERYADGMPDPEGWAAAFRETTTGLVDRAARDATIWCHARPLSLAQQTAAVMAWHEAPSDQWYPPATLSEPTAEDFRRAAFQTAERTSKAAAHASARAAARETSPLRFGRAHRAERAVQAALLRDIFGNPFLPVVIDPAWLRADVLGLAQMVYEERTFGHLPMLADALENAGCDTADVLAHCRGQGEHVPGCWVVDALLRKK